MDAPPEPPPKLKPERLDEARARLLAASNRANPPALHREWIPWPGGRTISPARLALIPSLFEEDAPKDGFGEGRMTLAQVHSKGAWVAWWTDDGAQFPPSKGFEGAREACLRRIDTVLASWRRQPDPRHLPLPPLLSAYAALARSGAPNWRKAFWELVEEVLGKTRVPDKCEVDEVELYFPEGVPLRIDELDRVVVFVEHQLEHDEGGVEFVRRVRKWLGPWRNANVDGPEYQQGAAFLQRKAPGAPPDVARELRRSLLFIHTLDQPEPRPRDRSAWGLGFCVGALQVTEPSKLLEVLLSWLGGDDRELVKEYDEQVRAGARRFAEGAGVLAALASLVVVGARRSDAGPSVAANVVMVEVLASHPSPPAKLDLSGAFTPFDWGFFDVGSSPVFPPGTRLLSAPDHDRLCAEIAGAIADPSGPTSADVESNTSKGLAWDKEKRQAAIAWVRDISRDAPGPRPRAVLAEQHRWLCEVYARLPEERRVAAAHAAHRRRELAGNRSTIRRALLPGSLAWALVTWLLQGSTSPVRRGSRDG